MIDTVSLTVIAKYLTLSLQGCARSGLAKWINLLTRCGSDSRIHLP